MIEDKVFERIEYLCQKKHFTMYKLAKEAGMPYSSLNNIIHRRTCPTVGTLEKLCKGLNMSLSDFFDFELYPLKDESLTQEDKSCLIYPHDWSDTTYTYFFAVSRVIL